MRRPMPVSYTHLDVYKRQSLGIANVMLSLPLHIAVLHNAGATALLFVLVTLLARLRMPE